MGEGGRAVRLVITGTVQGVGFRAFVERQASALGVTGTVRNLSDGGVEAVVHGADGAVEAMIAACRRGPSAANVREVQIAEHAGPAPVAFRVLPTR
jgi:acylphosphatase